MLKMQFVFFELECGFRSIEGILVKQCMTLNQKYVFVDIGILAFRPIFVFLVSSL